MVAPIERNPTASLSPQSLMAESLAAESQQLSNRIAILGALRTKIQTEALPDLQSKVTNVVAKLRISITELESGNASPETLDLNSLSQSLTEWHGTARDLYANLGELLQQLTPPQQTELEQLKEELRQLQEQIPTYLDQFSRLIGITHRLQQEEEEFDQMKGTLHTISPEGADDRANAALLDLQVELRRMRGLIASHENRDRALAGILRNRQDANSHTEPDPKVEEFKVACLSAAIVACLSLRNSHKHPITELFIFVSSCVHALAVPIIVNATTALCRQKLHEFSVEQDEWLYLLVFVPCVITASQMPLLNMKSLVVTSIATLLIKKLVIDQQRQVREAKKETEQTISILTTHLGRRNPPIVSTTPELLSSSNGPGDDSPSAHATHSRSSATESDDENDNHLAEHDHEQL